VGSSHDFSAAGWNSTGEICVVCHTPHNSDTTVGDAPLWNHETTTAVYTLYNSATFDAVPGQPDGVSKLCLSCHDGTIAVDNFGGITTGTQTMGLINPAADLTTDLSDDHPVSFTYDAALAAPPEELFDPTTTPSGLGGTIDTDMLFSAKVECASCHDVHDSGFASLLIMDNNASALCLTCHDK
jgi:predicted CXXCH cytochrome family protein